MPPPLLLATRTTESETLAKALDAEIEFLPDANRPEAFEAWRANALDGPPSPRIVVAPWPRVPQRARLMESDERGWAERFEGPYLLWNFALGVAAKRCLDGGVIVGVARTASALDVGGFAPERAIADGALSLIRSIAAAEGHRGVRAHLVTTPAGLVSGEVVAPAPPLSLFPGNLDVEVAGAVRTLLSEDARGLTGRLLTADGGRSL